MAQGPGGSRSIEQIGDYVVRRVVGEGGMGIVYEGVERLTGRRVALKVLHENLAGSEDARARFFTEMRIMASLEHANVVRSLASTEVDGKLVMVLEYLEGRTLREELSANGRIAPSRAVAIASSVASALAAAHGKQPAIVHRDLKPENVMLLPDDVVKVMDFGVAKVLAGDAKGATTQVVGTVQYMSPEQAEGGPITPSTDLYALGLVLYEMLCGEAPFKAASLLVLVRQHCDTPPPPFREDLKRGLPPGLERLVLSLLAKKPADRPRDAKSVLDSLSSIQQPGPNVLARVVIPPRPPGPKAGPPGARPRVKKLDTIALVDRFDRRKRWPWIAVGTAGFAILAIAAVAIVARSRGEPPAKAKAKPASSRVASAPRPVASARTDGDAGRSGDARAAFEPADPTRVDAQALFDEATKRARRVDGEAQLGGARLQNVIIEGAIDLTRADGVVSLTYDLPVGGLQVDVTRSEIDVTRFSHDYMDRVSPDVPCPFKRAFDVAKAAGFPLKAVTTATLTVGSLAGRSSWQLRTDEEVAVVEGPDCILKSASTTNRR